MDPIQAEEKKSPKKPRKCRRHGHRLVQSVLLIFALALVAWPAWNWVAAPLLVLPLMTYGQMAAVVALIGVVSMLLVRLSGRPHRFVGSHIAANKCTWFRQT